MTTLYGIKNCDTVKKAQKWLNNNNIDYTFYDLRIDGLTDDLLNSFVKSSNWQQLLNKRSTSYRNLPDEIKNNLTEENMFASVMEQPTLLKRPLLLVNQQLHIGFNDSTYHEIFNEK